jgi:serine protease DegS
MKTKKQNSQTFFLLIAAMLGFLLALGYDALFIKKIPIITTQSENNSSQIHKEPSPIPLIRSFAPAVNRAAPAVVNIFTRQYVSQTESNNNQKKILSGVLKNQQYPELYQEESNLGSGVIVSTQGHILTNNHVIYGAKDIGVLLKDGRYLRATLIGRDLETDLALLKVSAQDDLPIIHFGNSDILQVGDIVLAIGNPFGLGNSVTSGIISALNRSHFRANNFDNFIQTDAAINPGNSGGALVNTQGEMIGLNTINISNSGGSQGIGFAIPSSLARDIVHQLITFGDVQRGWIGIEAKAINPFQAQQLNNEIRQGLLIVGVLKNGPAAKAGIKAGDIITHINNQRIQSAKNALKLITQLYPGDMTILRGVRQNQSLQFNVTVQKRPQMSEEASKGH